MPPRLQVSGERDFFAKIVVDAVTNLDPESLDLRMLGIKKVQVRNVSLFVGQFLLVRNENQVGAEGAGARVPKTGLARGCATLETTPCIFGRDSLAGRC